jgi:hypothetical protein
VKDTWVIDPTRQIPEAALPPIPNGETRHNLLLDAHNGSVNADVHVYVAPGTMPEKKALRTSLKGKSHNGSVTLRVVSYYLIILVSFLIAYTSHSAVTT